MKNNNKIYVRSNEMSDDKFIKIFYSYFFIHYLLKKYTEYEYAKNTHRNVTLTIKFIVTF